MSATDVARTEVRATTHDETQDPGFLAHTGRRLRD